MLTVRRPRMFFFGLAVLLLVFAANHLEHLLRRQRPSDPQQPDIVVSAEQGPAGHSTLGIIEGASRSSRGQTALTFAALGEWQFDPKAAPPCPQPVMALNGKEVTCVGFMYPLATGDTVKVFCLLRSTQTCCYGPKPQFNQYLLVETAKPVKFERLTPVIVTGKFFVDPRPDEGFIYRMEGKAVRPIQEETPEINAAEAARRQGLPLLDFTLLAEVESSAEKTIPPNLLALDGRTVVVDGWIMERTQEQPPRMLVARIPESGPAPLPTLFNAVLVVPRNASQVPPVWKQKATFTGILHVTRNPSDWPQRGIANLAEAVLGVPAAGKLRDEIGPRIGLVWELVAVGMFLVLALRVQRPNKGEVNRA